MSKRSATQATADDDSEDWNVGKRLRFPEAAQLAEIFAEMDDSSGLIVRNNTEYLAGMKKLTLFTRPTQLGKSTLLSLAEMVYSKKETAPANVATKIQRDQRNAGYVIRFDFLEISIAKTNMGWQQDLINIDLSFFRYVKSSVADFLHDNDELKPYFTEPTANDQAGTYLLELSKAVKRYSKNNKTTEFFMVLVDEYDKPLRETLFLLLEQFEKSEITTYCPNYISFFHACKGVGQMLPQNKVWVTGIVPIVLDLISDFNPDNLTFKSEMLDAVGLRDKDVDYMLERVHTAEPFTSTQEMEKVRRAIQFHANNLQFLTGSPLYHTRMVNGLMEIILNPQSRKLWLQDLSRKPGPVRRERAPSAIYKVLQRSRVCREIAKGLVANRGIHGVLNEDLNLPDVARADISKDDYLTLLVHLGVASVQVNTGGQGHTFWSTSRFFRSEYLNAMLQVTLAPLFELSTVDEIFNRQALLEEFMATLPASGMSKMINWAKASKGNRILELHFQGFLVGELHDHFIADDATIVPTQEDVLGSKLRTDIQMKGNNTILILELKQKPSEAAPPTPTAMNGYHEQLHEYVEEVSMRETNLLVAGFVVVMYANGTKFQIERTTYVNLAEKRGTSASIQNYIIK